jgi:hypothetical protein
LLLLVGLIGNSNRIMYFLAFMACQSDMCRKVMTLENTASNSPIVVQRFVMQIECAMERTAIALPLAWQRNLAFLKKNTVLVISRGWDALLGSDPTRIK